MRRIAVVKAAIRMAITRNGGQTIVSPTITMAIGRTERQLNFNCSAICNVLKAA